MKKFITLLILLTIFLSGCRSYYKGFTPILINTGEETTEGKVIYEMFYIKIEKGGVKDGQ